jgi:hypothetical protein
MRQLTFVIALGALRLPLPRGISARRAAENEKENTNVYESS